MAWPRDLKTAVIYFYYYLHDTTTFDIASKYAFLRRSPLQKGRTLFSNIARLSRILHSNRLVQILCYAAIKTGRGQNSSLQLITSQATRYRYRQAVQSRCQMGVLLFVIVCHQGTSLSFAPKWNESGTTRDGVWESRAGTPLGLYNDARQPKAGCSTAKPFSGINTTTALARPQSRELYIAALVAA